MPTLPRYFIEISNIREKRTCEHIKKNKSTKKLESMNTNNFSVDSRFPTMSVFFYQYTICTVFCITNQT